MVSLEQGIVELRAVLARVPAQYRQQISTGDGAAPAQEAATPIAGTITDVQSAAGTQLVQVNIGSRDGVEANMKFLVHRDDQYVGTFVVDRVEAAQSAGRMTLKLEIFDSVTGALVASFRDRQEDPRLGWMEWRTRVSNRQDAQRMVQRWASQLRERLDELRGGQAAAD